MKRILMALATVAVIAGALVATASNQTPAQAAGTILVGDATPGDDGAFPYVCGLVANPCDTIQHGIDTAVAGDLIDIAAGTYTENVVVHKRLTIDGAGPGSTIVTAAAASLPAIEIKDSATGISPAPSDRLVIRDLEATGATGGSGDNSSGIQITGTIGLRYVTFDNVKSHANTGSGLAISSTGFFLDMAVTNSDLSNNGNAGIRLNTSIGLMDGLVVTGGTIDDNTFHGIITGPSGSPNVARITIDGTSFDGNGSSPSGGDGDIELFKFNGSALIKDVTVNADAHSGIQIRGRDAFAPSGPVLLQNVQITGNPTFGLQIHGYTSLASLSMSNVDIATTGNHGLYFENIFAPINIADTSFAPGNLAANITNVTGVPVDATGATFTGAADNFAIEDRVLHGIDAAGGGIVTWVPNNVYVTVNSFVPPLSLTPSIDRGIDAVPVNGTVNIGPGVFRENVIVDKAVEIKGTGAATTTVQPATSNPSCGPGSLCSGAASNVFLIRSSDVEIHAMTIDGDNPTLTGIVVGGADIDARNGIIEDFTLGVFDNTNLHDLVVQNIYLRAIYVASGGDNFSIADNSVSNVKGDPGSIAIFNFGGSGTITNNTVTDANDGIASNWSRGTLYQGNTVTNSGSGVHSDNNGGSGGVADTLDDNDVSNCATGGYGVWTFAPFVGPTVSNNTITNCAVGLAASGENGAGPVFTTFTNNTVDGAGLAGSTGVYVTTDRFGFGSTNVNATFTGNVIKNNDDGVYIESQPGFTATVDANFNEISGNAVNGALSGGGGAFAADLTANWWGSDTGPAHPQNPSGTNNGVLGNDIAFSPWLGFADDSAAAGFQLASPMTWWVSPGVCGATCIQAAIDYASAGDTVKVTDGVYPEHVTVNKQIVLTQGSLPIIDGGGSGDVVTITVPNVTVDGFEIRNGANGVVVAVGANNATVTNNEIHTFTSAGLRATSVTGADFSNNKIDGPHVGSCVGGFWGMRLTDVSGTLNLNDISGIGNGLTTGCQEGRAIEATGAGTLNITNNVIDTYQKSGIIVRDTVNTIISGNQTIGEGPSSAIAMNGITVTSTGTTSITGNTTSGHRYTTDSTQSCGILTFNTVTISGNTSTLDETAICLIGGNGSSVTGNIINQHTQQGILVDGALNVLIDDNDIDGMAGGTTASPGVDIDTDVRYYGIFVVGSTGTISNNTIGGITHGPSNGLQSGVGIRVSARPGETSDVDINGNIIDTYQKNGMVITNFYGGTAVHADIDGNTVTGAGPVNYIAQNGIQVSNGATATITNNDVSGHDYTPFTFAAVGLLIFDAGNVTISGNDIHDNMEGIYLQDTDNPVVSGNTLTNNYDASIFTYLSSNGTYSNNQVLGVPGSYGMYLYDTAGNNSVTGNAFRNHAYGVLVDYSGPNAPLGNDFDSNCIADNASAGMATNGTQVGGPIDAENNWWGRNNGPAPIGTGNAISPAADIDAVPFLISAVAGCPQPADGNGDGVDDVNDNCVFVVNPSQTNTNGEPMLLPKPSPVYNDATNPANDNEGDACDDDDDGDGILDVAETVLLLSPLVWDTDGDRTNDGTEIACGSNPLLATSNLSGVDTDNDRLPDACEAVYGTNPADVDSDDDFLLDGWEVRYWMSNPLVANTEGDDCQDAREVASVNGDRNVNSLDLNQLALRFGALTPEFRPFDSNGDGQISAIDLAFAAQRFGMCTP